MSTNFVSEVMRLRINNTVSIYVFFLTFSKKLIDFFAKQTNLYTRYFKTPKLWDLFYFTPSSLLEYLAKQDILSFKTMQRNRMPANRQLIKNCQKKVCRYFPEYDVDLGDSNNIVSSWCWWATEVISSTVFKIYISIKHSKHRDFRITVSSIIKKKILKILITKIFSRSANNKKNPKMNKFYFLCYSAETLIWLWQIFIKL